jgi:hypothetical protein
MPRPTKRAKAATQNRAAQVIPQNNKGIITLPSELLTEIASYFLTILSVDIIENPTTLPVEYRERSDILRALSQTCKDLRSALQPLAWERLEACTHTETRGQFFKEVGTALERKCTGILKCKHLLPHVRFVLRCYRWSCNIHLAVTDIRPDSIVTVSLTRYQTGTILPAFAECLAALPNLHTIQVVHAHSQMTTPLKNAFKGKSFPSVRTVIIPSCAHEILRCCPAVEDLTCNEGDGSTLIGALVAAKCNNLRTLRGIPMNSAKAKREQPYIQMLFILVNCRTGLVKIAPNLNSIYTNAYEVRQSPLSSSHHSLHTANSSWYEKSQSLSSCRPYRCSCLLSCVRMVKRKTSKQRSRIA